MSHTTVSFPEIADLMLHCSAYASADKYNDATANVDQTVSVNGVVVSTLSTRTAPCSRYGLCTNADHSQRAATAQVGAQVS